MKKTEKLRVHKWLNPSTQNLENSVQGYGGSHWRAISDAFDKINEIIEALNEREVEK